jgi:hypothetical protein
VDTLFDSVQRAYESGIEAPGKEVHFLVLVSFLITFAFIRTSTHMIRAQVSWWPGNVETKSGTHVHHLVWGILLLLVFGYLGLALDPETPWREVVAVFFGIGMGLTMDEFALWLNLEDVYWSEKGRQSIDAVIITACLLGLTMLGLQFWIDVLQAVAVFLGIGGEDLSDQESTFLLVTFQVIGAALTVICFLKGKVFTGITGLFLPLVALVGAVRKPKPESRWARRARSRSESQESRAPSRAR